MRRQFTVFPKGEHEEFFTLNSSDILRCTARQRSYIYGLLEKAQMHDDELTEVINPLCSSVKDFSPKDASSAISYLKEILY